MTTTTTPDETFTVTGGTAWILRAPDNAELRCPLIVVEGFPGGHGFDFSVGVLAQHGVLDALRTAGFDLVVLGLDDGLRSILDNAAVLRACIAEVMARTALPLSVLGWSMGGLIARVALADMEAERIDHHVTLLVTWDTPHRGTITQLGVQWFVAHLAAELPALAPFQQQLQSVANQEMDIIWLDAAGAPEESPHRRAFLQRLRWPQAPRRVLVACGRGDGLRTLNPGHLLVDWDGGERGQVVLRAAGGEAPIAEGSWGARPLPTLPGDTLGALDGVPGGREAYAADVAAVLAAVVLDPPAPPSSPAPSTCTVPTISALDLDVRPDVPVPADPCLIACESDQPHLTITAAAAPAIIRAIGAPFDPARFNPRDSRFLADPFPVYAMFRRWQPMSQVAAYQSLWCFRAEECEAILTGTDVWRKHPPGAPAPASGPGAPMAAFPPGLFSSDPPSHTCIRAAVEPLVIAAAADRAPAIAAAHAEQLLAGLAGRGRVELVQDYALPLPAAVLMDLLGVENDPAMRQGLMAWQSAITLAHDTAQLPQLRFAGLSASMALRTFFTGILQRQPPTPQPGLLTELRDSFAAQGLADELLHATLVDLLVAGYLSTTFLIATGMWRLLSNPDALSQVRADRTLLPKAIDELLRLDGPVQVIDRYAATATTLGDRPCPAGTQVTAVIGSADRDFDDTDPDALRLDRDARHFAFGRGIHTCVGAPLVEHVAPVAFGALLDLPLLELDGEPQWQSDPYLRSATSVPVRIA
ncbi:MAG TPA: cytochrome P450 [Solirubrobacteraceae bacterium]|nr:cytochrome P450 [Solirubrobacteraceae bacterium]